MMTKSATTIYLVMAFAVAGTVAAVQLSDQKADQQQDARGAVGAPATNAAVVAPAPRPDPISVDIDAGTFREIVEKQMPTVVSVRTLTRSTMPASGMFGDPSLGDFFGFPDIPTDRLLEGQGSGFVIDKSGLVLTNAHVVQDAQRIEVVLFSDPLARSRDTQRYTATVLGRDPLTDSALIQVEGAPELSVATLGNSDAMRPGDWVVAIGNPFALSHTVTVGVISATSRPFPVEGRQQGVLQTDAAVNPGNSGGPLLNLRGEVIGINTAIVPGGGGTNIGVGFAVPINLIRDLVPQLRQGDVQHGRLGVQVRDVPGDARRALGLGDAAGVLVAAVESGSPAASAGLEPGDVIVEVNGEEMDDADELVRVIGTAKPGTQMRLGIVRDKSNREIPVTLGQLTTGMPATQTGPAVEEGLGLTLSALTPAMARQLGAEGGRGGAVVTRVRPASPAAEAGLRTGDVIIEVNRQPVGTLDATMSRLRASAGPGSTTFLLVLRDGQRVFLVVGTPK